MTVAAHPWGPSGTVTPESQLATARAELAELKVELKDSRESLAIVRSALAAAEGEVGRLRKVAKEAATLGLACKTEALKDALKGLTVT